MEILQNIDPAPVISKLRAIRLKKQLKKANTIAENDPIFREIEPPALFQNHKVIENSNFITKNQQELQNLKEPIVIITPKKKEKLQTNKDLARMIKEMQQILNEKLPDKNNGNLQVNSNSDLDKNDTPPQHKHSTFFD